MFSPFNWKKKLIYGIFTDIGVKKVDFYYWLWK